MKDISYRDELKRFMSSTRMVWRRYKSFSDEAIHADLHNFVDDDSPWDNAASNETSTDTMIAQNQVDAGISSNTHLFSAKRRKSDADVFSHSSLHTTSTLALPSRGTGGG